MKVTSDPQIPDHKTRAGSEDAAGLGSARDCHGDALAASPLQPTSTNWLD